MANDITQGIKNLILAGIGAVADSAEKSEELMDRLVRKGETAVEQGRVLNEELKRSAHALRDEAAARVKAAVDAAKDKPADAPASECDTAAGDEQPAGCVCADGEIDTSKLTVAQKRALLDKLTKELQPEEAE